MEKFIELGKKEKADLICFPEVAVTPTWGKKEFIDFKGKYRKYFQKLAQKYSINLIFGSIIEGDKRGFYNTVYFINNRGKIKRKYKKTFYHRELSKNLSRQEKKFALFRQNLERLGL